jgi:hypothetical protein
VKVTIYTDPGCPFGFNAQRQELQLLWHYGPAADVERRMIVLLETSASFEDLGVSPDMVAGNRERLARLYGMPMGSEPVTRLSATIDACRAYVGARMHTPDSIASWLADGDVESALRADMAATRDPLPEALALPHKLSRSDGGLRYSTSSAVFEHGDRRVVAAGFQPFAVYEVAMASVAPDLERRDAPETVEEILTWAPFALATAEVAELRGIEIDQARDELQRAGATFTPSANDGYWAA